MNPDEPTHFNAIICGTGITESIVAAALSKAGYSVLHLDQSPTYGDTYASLFLSELAAFASSSPHATASPATPPPELTQKSGKFALSLQPLLLRATGGGIDLLVRSKVASYLQFGLLGGVGLVKPDGGGVERVPASKADVFNDDKLSLVEKRRLTKLLLFAAGNEPLEESKVLAENLEATFINVLQKSFSISPSVAGSIAYALALCSSPDGRYGPSPFLVGHYGGAGDLVGGFSRICAVWGGGQILGRPLHPLVLDPPIGPAVSAKPLLSSLSTPAPPPPPSTATLPATEGESGKKGSTEATSRPLGVPVTLDPKDGPVTFTGDWIVTSPSHLPVLFPSTTTSAPPSPPPPTSVYSITILSSPIPFPPPREAPDPEADLAIPDSHMFVFPPGVGEEENMGRLGTVTALQVGSGTFSCPEGYFVLYLAAPILQQPPEGTSAATLLQPKQPFSSFAPFLQLSLIVKMATLYGDDSATRGFSTIILHNSTSPPDGLYLHLLPRFALQATSTAHPTRASSARQAAGGTEVREAAAVAAQGIGPDAATIKLCEALRAGATGSTFLDGVSQWDVMGAWSEWEVLGAVAWYASDGGVIVTLSGVAHGEVASRFGRFMSRAFEDYFEEKDFVVRYDTRAPTTAGKAPDFTISVNTSGQSGNNARRVPCFIAEISRAQTRTAVIEKVKKIAKEMDSIVGGLVINLETSTELHLTALEIILFTRSNTKSGSQQRTLFEYHHADPSSTPCPPISASLSIGLSSIFPPDVLQILQSSPNPPSTFTVSAAQLDALVDAARDGLLQDGEQRERDKAVRTAAEAAAEIRAQQRIDDAKAAATTRRRNRKKTLKKLDLARKAAAGS
ncbi:Rab escort protein [Pseudohyphozyma bogoriensis]|nr:Rab escort protein [Pseudohyphozyma bogoriensis]